MEETVKSNVEEQQIVVVTETTTKNEENKDKMVDKGDRTTDTKDSTADAVSSPVAPSATDDERSDSLEVSTHELPGHMVDGDAHDPDQVLSDLSDNEAAVAEDDTSAKTVFQAEDLPREGSTVDADADASVQVTEDEVPRRSERVRQKKKQNGREKVIMLCL